MLYLIIIKSSSVISRVVKLKHPQRDQPVNMCIIKRVVVVVEQALSGGGVVVVEQYLNCRAPLIALAMAALKTCGTPSLMDHERGEMTER